MVSGVPPTTTRAAILGQLALRDWSAYELTRSMRRTLRYFWPRAESVIYAEAKKLEADGLAVTRTEPLGDGSRRTRTIYSITTTGRQALAAWLATQPTTVDLYLEPLLRVHLARFGTREDLLRAIDAAHAAANDILITADTVATEFVEGRHLFQTEAHLRAVLFDGLVSQAQALQRWAANAQREIRRWPEVTGDPPAQRRALHRMKRYLVQRQRDA